MRYCVEMRYTIMRFLKSDILYTICLHSNLDRPISLVKFIFIFLTFLFCYLLLGLFFFYCYLMVNKDDVLLP